MKPTTKQILSVSCLATALALTASTSLAQNILIDPGFETQTGWSLFNGAAYSSTIAHTGTESMLDAAANNVPGSLETFAATPGEAFDLTGFAQPTAALVGSGFGILQVTFFDAANDNLGTVATSPGNAQTSAQINSSSTPGVWTFLDTGVAVAPANTATIQAFTLYVGSAASQGVFFDDLSLQVVPEPSTSALMGLGLLGVCYSIYRRRKAAAPAASKV